MKKISFIVVMFLLMIGLSACAQKSPQPLSVTSSATGDDSHQVADDSASNPAPTTNQANNSAAANTVAPADQNQAVTTAPAASQPANNQTMPTPDNQVSLVKQYSQAIIKTNYGDIKVKFYGQDSPITVNNFLNLAQSGFYNGTKFHRVIKDFMIQGGDPLSKGEDTSVYGTGGPGYQFEDEFNGHKLVTGSLAMANSGPDTNGSQFFIVTATATPWLDGHHTNFGEVVSGLDIVKKIGNVMTGENDRPVSDVTINSIELVK
jgi:cyclophilin family peptidyl-prolyl cis-trans isomerase